MRQHFWLLQKQTYAISTRNGEKGREKESEEKNIKTNNQLLFDFITFVNSRFRYDLWIGFEFYNVICSSHWMENEMFNAFIINTTTKTGNYDQILFMCCGHFWWELQFTVNKNRIKKWIKNKYWSKNWTKKSERWRTGKRFIPKLFI